MSEPHIVPQPTPALNRVLATLRAHRDELAQRYHLREIGIFGSYVRDEQRATSDIDVLVEFDVVPSLFMILALEDELRDLLGAPVDIAVKSALRPHLGAHILRETIQL